MSDQGKPIENQLPWEWDESHWRGLVAQVRAGRALRPKSWPNGARAAVALSFDSDHETNELRVGGKSISALSWGEYGTRAGIPRIRSVLDRYDIKASFFIPAVSALLHPEEQRSLIADGHEIGVHGWIHEPMEVLDAKTERELTLRAIDTLEKLTGLRPVGIRTPSWDFNPATMSVLREAGFRYDSSLMADDDCYELLDHGEPSGIVEIPVEWIRDDAAYLMTLRGETLRPWISPRDVLEIFKDEFEGAYAAGGLFQLTMHPHVTGYRSRILMLEGLIAHMRSRGDIWFGTHAQVADWVREHSA
jgi:peptidoglycan/xylan/chitin deacetylase (PgdA/CDA1 family)